MNNQTLLHTDFGHDPDDAIALAYLIEHNACPDIIGITPGHIQQNESLSGLINKYWDDCRVRLNNAAYTSKNVEYKNDYTTGKYKIFNDSTLLNINLETSELSTLSITKAIIIGPPKNIGNLQCEEIFIQGGYSPNSINPLAKFRHETFVQSFNPSGAKIDFNKIVESTNIKTKYFIGKNVCHGFTKDILSKIWQPQNVTVKKFWDKLSNSKAMHDVLASILYLNKDFGIWEQAKPVWKGSKLSTIPTNEEIYSLIGLNI